MKPDHYQIQKRRDAVMRNSATADNIDVRKAILARIKSGEITLAQGQFELAVIQRNARKSGQQTAYG